MRFVIKNPGESVYNLMRKIGYHFQDRDESRGEISLTRPARGYPRFHIYLKVDSHNLIFNLHLDQRKPVYKGLPAHAGQYEGPLIKEEAERIRRALLGRPDGDE